jgi:excinuclease UvrABC ATPase subunit
VVKKKMPKTRLHFLRHYHATCLYENDVPDHLSAERLGHDIDNLTERCNTVIVVEHDPDVIKVADYIVDVGPKAGTNGGRIMFEGSYSDLLKAKTLTGEYIGRSLPIKSKPRTSNDFL